jgi:hypothetical protein
VDHSRVRSPSCRLPVAQSLTPRGGPIRNGRNLNRQPAGLNTGTRWRK